MKKYIILSVLLSFSLSCFAGSVIVNPSIGDTIDEKAISRIFLGKTKSFPGGDVAVPINLDDGSEGAENFNIKLLNRSSSQLKAYWSKLLFTGKGTPPTTVANDAEMIKLISANPNMIGYIEGAGDASVKVVFTY